MRCISLTVDTFTVDMEPSDLPSQSSQNAFMLYVHQLDQSFPCFLREVMPYDPGRSPLTFKRSLSWQLLPDKCQIIASTMYMQTEMLAIIQNTHSSSSTGTQYSLRGSYCVCSLTSCVSPLYSVAPGKGGKQLTIEETGI
jgi:hypothetical protein